ncbi:Gfo/Idh/MocA family protein [Nocardia sp. NPDC052566]|uniref:Gfo/Idh/MocA family protein n=1 Tax=Nocardia sp. NPDC052566 TaxID=3364330 RepID=UPI0037CC6992
MKIALLGTGFAQVHAAVYAQRNVEVVAFSRSADKLAEMKQRYGFEGTTDLDRLFTDPAIDLIDICLPGHLHAELILRGLAANKHVLSEVPLALTVDDAERVVAATAISDREVFVDMNLRFHPAYRRLRELLVTEELGALLAFESEVRSVIWPGYRGGLDEIMPHMLHGELDAIAHALGVPKAFTATGCDAIEGGAAAQVVFDYPGMVTRLSGNSMMPAAYGIAACMRATFAGGVLEYTVALEDATAVPQLAIHEYRGSERRVLAADDPDSYTAMIDHVLACLRGEAANEIAPLSVIESLGLTLDIQRALDERAARPDRQLI